MPFHQIDILKIRDVATALEERAKELQETRRALEQFRRFPSDENLILFNDLLKRVLGLPTFVTGNILTFDVPALPAEHPALTHAQVIDVLNLSIERLQQTEPPEGSQVEAVIELLDQLCARVITDKADGDLRRVTEPFVAAVSRAEELLSRTVPAGSEPRGDTVRSREG